MLRRLLLMGAFLVITASVQAQVQQPVLDLSKLHGEIRHNGNGFHGSIQDHIPIDLVTAIKPAMIRRYSENTIPVAKAVGSEVVALLPNYSQGQAWQTNWSGWETAVKKIVSDMKKAKRDHGISYHYDLWNEPENWPVPGNYFEFWCKTAAVIRREDPTARIAGPSYANSSNLKELVQYADTYSQQNNVNVVPDILNWHEFTDPLRIINRVAELKTWVKENGYDNRVKQYTVNELMMSPTPNVIPRLFYATEVSGLDFASVGYGGDRDPNTLNGLLSYDKATNKHSGTKYGAYNCYLFYANMTGSVVDVTNSEKVGAFATYDAEKSEVKILLGTSKRTTDQTVQVLLDNLDAIFAERGIARVSTERYKVWGGIDRQYQLDVPFTDGVLRLPLQELVAGVDLLPGSDIHGMAITITFVPEPASLGAGVVGATVLLLPRTRRK